MERTSHYIIGAGLAATALLAAALMFTDYNYAAPLLPFAVAGAFVLWRWPILGVAVIVGFAPLAVLREAIGISGALTLPKLAGVALLGVAAAQFLLRSRSPRSLQTMVWLPVTALIAVYIFSATFYADPADPGAAKAIRQLMTAILLFSYTLIFQDQIRIINVARALAAAVALPCLLQLFMDTGNIENDRASGLLHDPNYFAMLIIMVAPLTASLIAIEKHRSLKLAWGAALTLEALALLGTASRSGILVALFSASLAAPIFWRFVSGERKTLRRAIIALFAGIAVAVAAAPEDLAERFADLGELTAAGETGGDRSLDRRASYWTVGTKMISTSPLFGHGPGSFMHNYSQSPQAIMFASSIELESYHRKAHNTYLELAAETGLTGLLAFAGSMGLGLFNFQKVRAHAVSTRSVETYLLSTAFAISFAAGLANLFFLSDQANKFIWFYLAISAVWAGRIKGKQ